MNLADLTQLSVAGIAIVTLGYGLRMFLKHLSKRDEQLHNLVENHLNRNTESNDKLRETFHELHIYLKGKNGSR